MKLESFDRDGIRVWLEDGILLREIPLGDGTCRHYHKNGALECEYEKVGGKTHGLVRAWHDNGELAKELTRVDGQVVGTVRIWNREGILERELEYVTPAAIYGTTYHRGKKMPDVFLWNGKPISKSRWLKKVEAAGIPRSELERRFLTRKP